ncbi:MAG: replication factor C subunit 3 [Amphiamblys sp. WSBS2006]|nr:MAG: replication factor C subunit 3 [Amphiamblys sp. WSBS2006]
MSLWAENTRPNTLDELSLHHQLNDELKTLSRAENIPSLLFSGPVGAGKRTRITLLLKAIYGQTVEKTRTETVEIETPSQKVLSFPVLMSKDHLEINPSTLGIYDRLGIQKILETTGQSQQLDAKAARKYKVLVIHDADNLSRDAMHSLRRAMEKYVLCIRIFFCCVYPSKIIPALRSRTLPLCVPSPSREDIEALLARVAAEKNVEEKAIGKIPEITEACRGNVRRGLFILQAAAADPETKESLSVIGWETVTKTIAEKMRKSPTPQTLLSIRANFYDLLSHCIPPTMIIKSVLMFLLKDETGDRWTEFVSAAAKYETRAQRGGKGIYHLEAFAANVMASVSRKQ